MALFKKLKDLAVAGSGSATVGIAAGIVAVGVAVQASPALEGLFKAIVPDNYEGLALSALGLVFAIARFRTLGK